MPKENTHILLSDTIIETIDDGETRRLLRANLDAFRFGSIVLDTFFYSDNHEIAELSHRLHGRDGEQTNELTFHLLDLASGEGSERILSVALGQISHCVFDMMFHPVIYYLVGNYYDADPEKRRSAVYRHRLMETGLDWEMNNGYYLDDLFAADNGLAADTLEIFAARYRVEPSALAKAFRKQVISNRYFRSRIFYRLIRILNRLKIIDFDSILPLFYGHLQKDEIKWDRVLHYRDIIDGTSMKRGLSDLFLAARDEAINRIVTAIAYCEGRIDRDTAERIIRGESLDTGRAGCSVREIIHTR